MNLTYSGVTMNGELVTVTTDAAQVSDIATEFSACFREQRRARMAWSAFMPLLLPPNDLSPPLMRPWRVVAWAREAWLRYPASPFFLPVSASGWRYWYAICPDRDNGYGSRI